MHLILEITDNIQEKQNPKVFGFLKANPIEFLLSLGTKSILSRVNK